MAFWSLAFMCKMCRPPLWDPLKLSVIFANRWRHSQFPQDNSFLMSLAFVYCFRLDSTKIYSIELRWLLNSTFCRWVNICRHPINFSFDHFNAEIRALFFDNRLAISCKHDPCFVDFRSNFSRLI